MKSFSKLFGVLVMLFSFLAVGTLQAQTTVEEFVAKWGNGEKFTLDVLNAMPDSGMDYKPADESMSFKEQLHHIGGGIVGISQGFLNGDEASAPKLDLEGASKEDLAKYLSDAYAYGKATVAALSEEELAEVIPVFGTEASRRQVIALIDDHCTHHRGVAVAYLRANGVKPPSFVGF